MSKYYTPEIEEFYVGFEYYTTTHPVSMEEFSPYVKGEFDHNTFEREFDIDTDSSGEIIKIGVPSCIKVKYLDREDIESLGFKYSRYSGSYTQYFTKDNIEISIGSADRKDSTLRVKRIWSVSNEIVFKGTIKNKSELKKLLKQLGI